MSDVVDDPDVWVPEPMDIHTWFELTYSNFLVLHRSLMQSMPEDWQHRATAVFEELRDAFSYLDHPDRFRCQAVDSAGRFAKDPIPHYNRGRTFVPPLLPTTICNRCDRPRTDHLSWFFDGPPEGAVHGGPADFGFPTKFYCIADAKAERS